MKHGSNLPMPGSRLDHELASLHDATLVRVVVEWGEGVGLVVAKRSVANGGEAVLRVTGVRRIECPRHLPWGPSSSINEVRYSTNDAGVRLEVEVQSGDVIVIEGKKLVDCPPDPS